MHLNTLFHYNWRWLTAVSLAGDEDYIKKRQEAQAARHKTAGSMAGHRQDFANEVSDGFAGIFAKPMAGFSEVRLCPCLSHFQNDLSEALVGA